MLVAFSLGLGMGSQWEREMDSGNDDQKWRLNRPERRIRV